MLYYTVDEFLTNKADTDINIAIDKKISLLYECGILRGRPTDSREDAVRAYLKRYSAEHQLTRALHDVIVGNKTIDQLLKGAYTNV